MMNLNHCYSLNGDWLHKTSPTIGASQIYNKATIIPDHIGSGTIYCTCVTDEISVTLLDARFTDLISINQKVSADNLYILHYDLSNKINPLSVNDDAIKTIPKGFKSGFTVLRTGIESSLIPIVGQRIFVLRILIKKKALLKLLNENNKEIKNIEKKILYHNHINSDSIILINSLRQKHFFDLDYDVYLKGITLKIFANFIETFTNLTLKDVSKIDRKAIAETTEYLLKNPYEKFPSITFLAKMAKMSATKYKTLFKKINSESPNQLYNNNKMKLAKELLESGKFDDLNEIINLLNFQTRQHFTNNYFKYYKNKPNEDFKKKPSP